MEEETRKGNNYRLLQKQEIYFVTRVEKVNSLMLRQ